jgi:hypothetical protein
MSWPPAAKCSHRLDNGRPEYYGADSYGETTREIAFEHIFNQGH